MLIILSTAIALFMLVILRIHIGGKLGLTIIDEIHKVNMWRINAGLGNALLDYDRRPSLDRLIFDLTIWTKQQAIRRYVTPMLYEPI